MIVLVYLYFTLVLLLAIYGLHRTRMIWTLWRNPYQTPVEPPVDILPTVCVQLPLFNEAAVAERVIRAAVRIKYPEHLLELQVLDDSFDETTEIVDRVVGELRSEGWNISCLRRRDRAGFKAGALAEGMKQSQAEYFAVFDADFIPPPDFLYRVIPHFSDEQVGFVQACWKHLNRRHSFFTAGQAVLLDAHFFIEHAYRYSTGAFFNFNGTAGVWRASAVWSAGGWQGDTLTEDLDLSYRTQLNGWKGVYLRDVDCDSELPSSLDGFKSQQHRWTKGASQVFRKLFWKILRSEISVYRKVEALFHLSVHLCYVFAFLIALLLVPVAAIRSVIYVEVGAWFELLLFMFMLSSFGGFFVFGQYAANRSVRWRDIGVAICLGVGITAHCAIASLSGLFFRRGEFVRTPKFGDRPDTFSSESWRVPIGCALRTVLGHRKELFMASYLGCGILWLLWQMSLLSIPIVLLIVSGYSMILVAAVLGNCGESSKEPQGKYR